MHRSGRFRLHHQAGRHRPASLGLKDLAAQMSHTTPESPPAEGTWASEQSRLRVLAASSPVSILLVDDEPRNLVAMSSLLESENHQLVQAASGEEALRHVLQNEFAVILLDVHMPGMDGFETAELIRGRESTRETPIIFLTAALTNAQSISRGY